MEFWKHLFDGVGFMPRIQCGEWSAWMIALTVAADMMIWLSYMLIPFVMLYIVLKKRATGPYTLVWVLYIGFILSCGMTHFIDAWMFWYPLYRLALVVKSITAILSVITVGSLFAVTPLLLKIKTPVEVAVETHELHKMMDQIESAGQQLSEQKKVVETQRDVLIDALKGKENDRSGNS